MEPEIGEFSIPAFIIKIYEILEDHNKQLFYDIIRWNNDGTHFIVLQPKLMEAKVLLKYFKHNHFSSFLRQLNMYEFIKSRNSENHQTFTHPHFRKGFKNELPLIKRNPIKCRTNESSNEFKKKHKLNQKINRSQNDQQLDFELNQIKSSQSQFESQFSHILYQNENIIRQHKLIQTEICTYRKQIDTKVDRISLLLTNLLQQANPMNYEQVQISSFIQQQNHSINQINGKEFKYSYVQKFYEVIVRK